MMPGEAAGSFSFSLPFVALQVVKERLMDLLSREDEEESHGEDVVRVTPDPVEVGGGGGGRVLVLIFFLSNVHMAPC